MWDRIAHKTLGSIHDTDKLMMANRRCLGFYTFPAGIVLTLPEVGNESGMEGLPPRKQ
ncbi:phage tail protein [Acutalibacter intestini]|uniref:phage tail protein n=1 Tax=Acutalibacter intestini TaxID=3093659 RepID=UPI002AC9809A|nr:phage tail protein [Acutalibacter sp. M00204]